MSRSVLHQRLMALREKILTEGKSEFVVFGPQNRKVGVVLSWEQGNDIARELAARYVGDEYRVEERKWLDGVCAVARCRHWTFNFIKPGAV